MSDDRDGTTDSTPSRWAGWGERLNHVYRTRLRTTTVILVAVWFALLAFYAFSSQHYPPEPRPGQQTQQPAPPPGPATTPEPSYEPTVEPTETTEPTADPGAEPAPTDQSESTSQTPEQPPAQTPLEQRSPDETETTDTATPPSGGPAA